MHSQREWHWWKPPMAGGLQHVPPSRKYHSECISWKILLPFLLRLILSTKEDKATTAVKKR
jgi:hypothetical protein